MTKETPDSPEPGATPPLADAKDFAPRFTEEVAANLLPIQEGLGDSMQWGRLAFGGLRTRLASRRASHALEKMYGKLNDVDDYQNRPRQAARRDMAQASLLGTLPHSPLHAPATNAERRQDLYLSRKRAKLVALGSKQTRLRAIYGNSDALGVPLRETIQTPDPSHLWRNEMFSEPLPDGSQTKTVELPTEKRIQGDIEATLSYAEKKDPEILKQKIKENAPRAELSNHRQLELIRGLSDDYDGRARRWRSIMLDDTAAEPMGMPTIRTSVKKPNDLGTPEQEARLQDGSYHPKLIKDERKVGRAFNDADNQYWQIRKEFEDTIQGKDRYARHLYKRVDKARRRATKRGAKYIRLAQQDQARRQAFADRRSQRPLVTRPLF